ncbi:MAG: zinc-dependent metalloprotease [Bacteroidota bacterium]
MRSKLLIIISLWLFGLTIHAQHANQFCFTAPPFDSWEIQFQKLVSDYQNNHKSQKQSSIIYTIPIIFHVIHSGQSIGTFPNISQGQINSQLTVINQDFSGNGYNSSNYPSNAFVNWVNIQSIPSANIDSNGRVKIADVGIQFCLATMDTTGNLLPEPGINRINFLSMNLPDPSSYPTQATMKSYLDDILKPKTIWDVTKYLNVWITDKNSALSYTGVSSVPPLSGLIGVPNNTSDSTDGIWCFAKVIGSNNLFPSGIYGSPLVEGRTLTHELGHYLGLRHIWGDGACATDYCDDTPAAAAQNNGLPNSYPLNVGSCNNPTNSPDGEMFMNFMDYTWDPYKYMFTTDQTTRMRTAMINSPFRNQLGTHGLCSATIGLNEVNTNNKISVYPNPATTHLNLNVSKNDVDEVSISNLLGQVLIKEQIQNRIDISFLTNGIYLLTVVQGQNKFIQKFIKEH